MIRTLIVDDDYRVAELHCEYVSRVRGYMVAGQAHSGAEALDSIERLRPDLVLLDIYLPDISGLEVLQRMREDPRYQVDVIAITAARDVEVLRSAIRGGVVHYLIKPFRLAAFEEKLTSYAAASERLGRLALADQGAVDRVFSALRSSSGSGLPKGLSDSTLELVVSTLHETARGRSAAAVASATGLSRVTARRYLDHLCRLGTAELTLRYGAPGRPEHRYRLLTGAR
jgi:two-component system CitB family response regulator